MLDHPYSSECRVCEQGEAHTTRPTHVRIYKAEGSPAWYIDGADDSGGFTEEVWRFYTQAQAVHAARLFVMTTTIYHHYKWDWRHR